MRHNNIHCAAFKMCVLWPSSCNIITYELVYYYHSYCVFVCGFVGFSFLCSQFSFLDILWKKSNMIVRMLYWNTIMAQLSLVINFRTFTVRRYLRDQIWSVHNRSLPRFATSSGILLHFTFGPETLAIWFLFHNRIAFYPFYNYILSFDCIITELIYQLINIHSLVNNLKKVRDA